MQSVVEMGFGSMLDDLGARTPAPGGGAVGGAVGALAAALGQMVLAWSIGRKASAEHDEFHESVHEELVVARRLLLRLADEDAAAYESLAALMKLDKSDPVRLEQFGEAVDRAIAIPRSVMATGLNLLRRFESILATSNPNLRSDLAIAAVLAEATVRASAWNVAINLSLLDDSADGDRHKQECRESIETARRVCAEIESACGAGA